MRHVRGRGGGGAAKRQVVYVRAASGPGAVWLIHPSVTQPIFTTICPRRRRCRRSRNASYGNGEIIDVSGVGAEKAKKAEGGVEKSLGENSAQVCMLKVF
jgi:hypothetical protein